MSNELKSPAVAPVRCGVVGYKPGLGRVSRAGVKSLAEALDVVGGFDRCVRDVALLGAVLTGDARLLDLDAPAPRTPPATRCFVAAGRCSACPAFTCRLRSPKALTPDCRSACNLSAVLAPTTTCLPPRSGFTKD